ncbi:hypothetical protein FGO68_gene8891 [Halteria grandinella]|uniref:3-hydroxyisobutyryl-CoA hydrolase n=1 Tax=Halteria grandinella TaxID=5974 RepID=A0A8J8NPC4_HALGN|nr:hypothetical protein FGO68_gene8891 [Halteria grandinella]
MENHSPALTEFKLNVPKTLNSLDMDMVHKMLEKVKYWHFNPEQAPRVLLISGVGGKAFCAGGDIKMVYESGIGKLDPSIKAKFFHDEYVLDYSLTQMRPLQISIWNGIVMGGGVGVSVHAPIRVATDNTVYAMPETGIGFFTDVGGAYFLSRIKHNIQHGLYLGLTGQRIKARELVQWGIATHFVPQTHIEGLYKDLKEKVRRESSDKEIHDIVNSHSDLTVDQTPIPDEKEIEWLFQNDSILDIVTRIEKDATPFGEKVRKQIASLSPLSLAVVFEQIKRGKTMGLKEVFEMEYKISQGFTNHTEFFEGVRALLIDKDRNPQWKYKHVRDVTQKDLDHFFNRDDVLDLTLKQ